ncbi:MAG TPA: N,N-dimethylformamidase beta subunit family domain-containing protein, partial [Acidobacteriaceae bacterium]|nr:N,N-dimethylformamidase beta subunit family domain-containing protein [Acidobacteriaceae bacterium]
MSISSIRPFRKFAVVQLIGIIALALAAHVHAQCANPANAIVAENCLTGNPSSEWDIPTGDAGDLSIQGFSTDISVTPGNTISFKINTVASAYTINIYRIGYYQGNGARKVATITPSVRLPQQQPACISDSTTGLTDCGNWNISASWAVPTTAVSGVYVAHLVRSDTGGNSHIVFVVRNDTSHSAILYQTSDPTWVAYNYYGNGSLYGPGQPVFGLSARTFAVSYNRPALTRGFNNESATWFFGAEFAMVQWLEQNGYDVSYFTGLDADRNGALIKNHKVYMDSGHDEYVSPGARANVKAARDAGVNLAFFSGNEFFWKTRWANSSDGSNTPYRTL